jgi:DnaJ-class molecular chaperone
MADSKDLYAILEVPRDASEDDIRTSYRRLARRHHPDVNPGDREAEERFKAVSRAYAVLSDPEKRRNYDEFGEASLDSGFDADAARRMQEEFGARFGGGGGGGAGRFEGEEFSFGGIEDILSGLFGRGGAAGRQAHFRARGPDVEAELQLDFLEAARGCEKRLTLARPRADGGVQQDSVTVRIPPGVEDGGRIRLRGKGGEGMGGGPPGDLFARVRVSPHRVFRREGLDLHLTLPVTVQEAVLGAKVDVPTLEGRATVTVPPGTDGGTRLRLKGKGVTRDGRTGDLYAVVQIRVPKDLDDAGREALERLGTGGGESVREELFR